MSDLTGENLLNIFNDLNIQFSLNANVVRGWFDTDDNSMKKLLNWMCTSLSMDNFVSPLEHNEYNKFETLGEVQLEQEVKLIETKYPYIFDLHTTQLDISILESELEILEEEENNLDKLIFMSETVANNLSQTWNEKLALEIKTESELLSTQQKCKKLSEDLDDRNSRLHKQLIRHGNNLFNFEFNEQPCFINNIGIELYQEKLENFTSIIKPFLEIPLLSISCSLMPNNTCLSITSFNESMENSLLNLKNRISFSHQTYVNCKIEEEKMKEILAFLSTNSVNSIISLSESSIMQYNIEAKKETKSRMFSMLENVSMKITDQKMSLTKQEYTKNELEIYQQKLGLLSTMEELLVKVLSQYLVLYILYQQEKEDIENSDKYFRQVMHYINQDLQICIMGISKMKEVTKQYKSVESQEKCKLIKSMLGVLGINKELNLIKAYETIIQVKTNLNTFEKNTFSISKDYKALGNDMKQNIQALESFLICGPTHSVISVPCKLLSLIKKTAVLIEKQNKAIREGVEITTSIKRLNKKKWDVYKRQLWMYFYTDPQKIKFVMQQIEEEFLKLKIENEHRK